MCRRYNVLPSVFLREGTTLDIQCAEVAIQHEAERAQLQHDQANGKINSNMTQEQMQAMLDNVRATNK